MKIAVVAANGHAGKLITNTAVARGLDVTAIVRHENKTDAHHVLQKDLFDLTAADVADFDVVVDAFGNFADTDLHVTSLRHLADVVAGTNTRLMVVGGAGSLYVDAAHTTQLVETPDFPAEFKPLAQSMAKALTELRARKDVKWTYISPAADFQADGPATGVYRFAGEELPVNAAGKSEISYADYAQAFVAVIQSGAHENERISVVSR